MAGLVGPGGGLEMLAEWGQVGWGGGPGGAGGGGVWAGMAQWAGCSEHSYSP